MEPHSDRPAGDEAGSGEFAMLSARAKEVLYDSEVVLRLVDSELEELRESAGSATAASDAPGHDNPVQLHPLRDPVPDPSAERLGRRRHTH